MFDGGAGRRGGLALRAVRGCGDGYQPSRGRRTIGLHGGNVVSNPSSSICAAHLARRALWSAGAAGDKAPVPLHWRKVCRSVDDTRPADPLPALLRLQARACWTAGAQLWYSAAEAAATAAAAASAAATMAELDAIPDAVLEAAVRQAERGEAAAASDDDALPPDDSYLAAASGDEAEDAEPLPPPPPLSPPSDLPQPAPLVVPPPPLPLTDEQRSAAPVASPSHLSNGRYTREQIEDREVTITTRVQRRLAKAVGAKQALSKSFTADKQRTAILDKMDEKQLSWSWSSPRCTGTSTTCTSSTRPRARKPSSPPPYFLS